VRSDVFFGHGNLMYAVQSNAWTKAWAAIGNVKVSFKENWHE